MSTEKINLLILEDSSYSNMGGGQVVTLAIIRGLCNLVKIDTYDFLRTSNFSKMITGMVNSKNYFYFGLNRIKDSKNSSTKISIFRNILYLLIFPLNIINLLFFVLKIKNKKKLICYSATRHTHIYALILKIIFRIKIVAHIHSFEPKDTLRYKLNKLILLNFDLTIFVSNFISKIYNLQNAIILYNPVEDIEGTKFINLKRNINPIRIGFVGNFFKWKGIEVFIDSCFLFSDLINSNQVSVNLYGNGPLFKNLSSIKYPFEITFNGYTDNKKIYSNLDIVVAPSIDKESCPMVVLESINLNKIIITTNFGGQKELIETFGGFLVTPNNPNEIEFIIRNLCNDKQKYHDFKTLNLNKLSRQNLYIENIIYHFNKLLIEKLKL